MKNSNLNRLKTSAKPKKSLLVALFGEELAITLKLAAWYLANIFLAYPLSIWANEQIFQEQSSHSFLTKIAVNAVYGFGLMFAEGLLCTFVKYGYQLCKSIPLFLQRQYLPVTEEELKALSFESEDDFYNFILNMCSFYSVFKKERVFVKSMEEETRELVILYNNSTGKCRGYIGESCPKELRDFLNEMAI